MTAKEVDHLPLGPAAIIAVGLGEKRAVASVLGFEQRDVRIAYHFGARLWHHTDEGISLSVVDQCGHGDFVHYAATAPPMAISALSRESPITHRAHLHT